MYEGHLRNERQTIKNSHYAAQSKLERAKEIFKKMVKPNSGISYPQVIYQAQEASELAFKAILDEIEINYKRTHNMSKLLQDHQTALPLKIRKILKPLEKDLSLLSKQRTTAKYNHVNVAPVINKPSYSKFDVQRAKYIAQKLIDLAQEFIKI